AVRATRSKRNPLTKFAIELEDNKTTFLPGQQIKGRVVTQLYKTETSVTNSNTSTITLFKELETFIGSIQPAPAPEELARGEHHFPFVFRVPPAQLPASFEGRNGRVKYEVAAVLARPGQINKLVHCVITIPSTLDSSDLDMLERCEAGTGAPVGLWFWKSGHLAVTVSLPKTGFSSEEIVPLKIEITNHSGSGAILKDISLKQRCMYKVVDVTRGPVTENIHRINFTERFSSQTRKVSRYINFPIPPTSVMSPDITSTILNVTHVLTVKILSKARFSKPIKVELPIVVTGFPAVYFDHTQNISVETLPMYQQRGHVVHSLEALDTLNDDPGTRFPDSDDGEEEEEEENDGVEEGGGETTDAEETEPVPAGALPSPPPTPTVPRRKSRLWAAALAYF
ncbi:Arrestin domain-containing protein 3, partial [Thoreauomyces humboldtii]